MAGEYIKTPEWNVLPAARALANMVARGADPRAIERVDAMLKAWALVEREFEVFRDVLQKFENAADGRQWNAENVQSLLGAVKDALEQQPVAQCAHQERGFRCRLDPLHVELGEPHVY